MSVILIGYRGCGKTTIGRLLADRLWHSFVDVDERIVGRAGKTIKEIFEQDGEPAFREMEAQIVREYTQLQDHVIALGGGSLQRQENHQLVTRSGHKVIYLRCDPEVLLERIGSDPATATARPNLTALGGGLEEIKALLADREPVYRSAMTSELDVTHLTPREAVVHIARMI